MHIPKDNQPPRRSSVEEGSSGSGGFKLVLGLLGFLFTLVQFVLGIAECNRSNSQADLYQTRFNQYDPSPTPRRRTLSAAELEARNEKKRDYAGRVVRPTLQRREKLGELLVMIPPENEVIRRQKIEEYLAFRTKQLTNSWSRNNGFVVSEMGEYATETLEAIDAAFPYNPELAAGSAAQIYEPRYTRDSALHEKLLQDTYLGTGENYRLEPQKNASDEWSTLRMKTALDTPSYGAIIFYPDLYGVRQVIVRPHRSPTYFTATKDFYCNLEENAWIVYGDGWETDKKDPLGGEGWFHRVRYYCAPGNTGAFINGKREHSKNLWLSMAKVEPRKTVSKARFLRGIGRLKGAACEE